jgi:hypothetical protein
MIQWVLVASKSRDKPAKGITVGDLAQQVPLTSLREQLGCALA